MALSVETMVNMLRGAAGQLRQHEEYLNRINVFPVPDGDTGTNMAYTMHAVERALTGKKFENLRELGEYVLKQAMLSSRGNSGTLLTQFLKGLTGSWGGTELSLREFARCLTDASLAADKSFMEPRAGTALDVIREVGRAALELAEEEVRDAEFFSSLLATAEAALETTKQILPQMRKAHVVDSGGAGMVLVYAGFLEGLMQEAVTVAEADAGEMREIGEQELVFRFCTEVVLEIAQLDKETIQDRLTSLGDSLQMVDAEGILKIHIHTNQPHVVRDLMSEYGTETGFKAEDMVQMQKASLAKRHDNFAAAVRTQQLPLMIITDSSADIPASWVADMPLKVARIPIFQAGDGEDLADQFEAEDFYARMFSDKGFVPKTSKVGVGQFVEAFEEALQVADKVLCLPMSSGISGTYDSALQAQKMLDESHRVLVQETYTGSAGLAVLAALSNRHQHLSLNELSEMLKEWRRKLHAYFLVEDTQYLVRGGRLQGGKAFLAKWLGLQPLLKLEQGKLKPQKEKILFSQSRKMNQLLYQKAQQHHRERPLEHILIVYAGPAAQNRAEQLKNRLVQELDLPLDAVLALPLNMAVGAHTGPGSMGLILY